MKQKTRPKLSKSFVATLGPPEPDTPEYRRGYRIVWDGDLKGFGCLITVNGIKSYLVQRRIDGVQRRKTLGRTNVLSADMARKRAEEWLGKIAAGGDPVAEARRDKLASITLQEAMDGYLAGATLRPSTQQLVRGRFARNFADWLPLPLAVITEDMVERLYLATAKTRPQDANIAFRYFRAVWNHARTRQEDVSGVALLPPCPTRRPTKSKTWAKDTRRQRMIPTHRLADWWAAVEARPDPAARVYLKFMLYTGARRSDVAALRWAHVDLTAASCVFHQTKQEVYSIPLCRQLVALLAEQRTRAAGPYVFPDASGRLRDPRSAFHGDIQSIRAAYGEFGPHDLRRGFITTAEMIGVPGTSTKKLAGHKVKDDVTSGYFVATVEALRPHAQAIADQLDAWREPGEKSDRV